MTFEPPAFVAPAFLHIPAGRTGSLGPEVVDFAASIGHPVDPEQAADIDAFASLGAGGLYLGGTVCKIEGRQNGKTDRVILPMTMFDFFVLGVPAVTWTAHLMDTTRKTKAIVERLIEANPSLSARVKEIIDARDSEAIVLMSGAVWEWRARSDAGGRGGQADIWVADEGGFLTPGMIGARRPTMRSRPNAQMRIAASAALRRSKVLRGYVARGRSGTDPTLVYSEHCAPGSFEDPGCRLGRACSHVPGTPGCTLDREDLWHLANHAMGRRITYAKMRDERLDMDPAEFARELLGWHEPGDDDDETIPVGVWDDLSDRASKVRKSERPAFAVLVRPDQSSAVVSVAGARHDAKTHLGLIRERVAVDQVVDEVVKLHRKHHPRIVVLGPGPATKRLAPALKAAGVRLRVATDQDLAQAAATLLASVKLPVPDIAHRGDPLVRASLEASKPRRTTDGGWTFECRGDADSVPIVSLALARWGYSVAPRVLTEDELRDSLG